MTDDAIWPIIFPRLHQVLVISSAKMLQLPQANGRRLRADADLVGLSDGIVCYCLYMLNCPET